MKGLFAMNVLLPLPTMLSHNSFMQEALEEAVATCIWDERRQVFFVPLRQLSPWTHAISPFFVDFFLCSSLRRFFSWFHWFLQFLLPWFCEALRVLQGQSHGWTNPSTTSWFATFNPRRGGLETSRRPRSLLAPGRDSIHDFVTLDLDDFGQDIDPLKLDALCKPVSWQISIGLDRVD